MWTTIQRPATSRQTLVFLTPVYDLAKAKAALAASGLGHPAVTMVYPSDRSVNGLSFGDLAARVQQQLAQVGITVKLQGQSIQVALPALKDFPERSVVDTGEPAHEGPGPW